MLREKWKGKRGRERKGRREGKGRRERGRERGMVRGRGGRERGREIDYTEKTDTCLILYFRRKFY